MGPIINGVLGGIAAEAGQKFGGGLGAGAATLAVGYFMKNATLKTVGAYQLGSYLGDQLPVIGGGGSVAGGAFEQMAATPKYAAFFFRGLQTGKTYAIDAYVSDVAGAKVTFDEGAGAGSGTADFITFDENVVLEDYSQVTGTADTEKIRIVAGGKPTRHVLRYALHLTTLNNRPKLNIAFKAGTRISAFQIAD